MISMFCLFACAGISKRDKTAIGDQQRIQIEVPVSLKAMEVKFRSSIERGEAELKKFAHQQGLSKFTDVNLVKRAVLLENKNQYDDLMRRSSNLPPDSKIPTSFVAIAEADVLWILPPEEVARLNPRDAKDPNFYSKLVAHELGHVLHVRALRGKETEMGPVWFYEGFAVAAANQYDDFAWPEYEEEFEQVIRDQARGDYRKYGAIFRKLLERHSMTELLTRAKEDDLNDWAISSLRKTVF